MKNTKTYIVSLSNILLISEDFRTINLHKLFHIAVCGILMEGFARRAERCAHPENRFGSSRVEGQAALSRDLRFPRAYFDVDQPRCRTARERRQKR